MSLIVIDKYTAQFWGKSVEPPIFCYLPFSAGWARKYTRELAAPSLLSTPVSVKWRSHFCAVVSLNLNSVFSTRAVMEPLVAI